MIALQMPSPAPRAVIAELKNAIIAPQDVERRFAGRWEAVAKVLPYCDEAEFYDNDNGFQLVAEYRNGELWTVGSIVPGWLKELRAYLDSSAEGLAT